MHLHALICVREHVSDVILMLTCMWGECVLLEVVYNLFFCVCMLIFYLDSWLCYLTGFVVDGIPYAYINMYLQAYVWRVSVDNKYIGGVRAVGSGLQSFFCVCVLSF